MAIRKFGRFPGVTTLDLRHPPLNANPWTRLCFPVDYGDPSLDQEFAWHQKQAKTRGNPWVEPVRTDYKGMLAAVHINSGTSVVLHRKSDYWAIPSGFDLMGRMVTESGWTLDKVNKKFSFEFYLDNDLEETSATVIYDDDETFWSAYQTGSGSFGITLSEETTTVQKGASSLKMAVAAGSYSLVGVTHTYGSAQDWSSKEFVAIWWYGANTGATWHIRLGSAGGAYIFDFADNFSGWQRTVKPINNPDSQSGTFDLTAVTYVDIYTSAPANGTTYLDRTVVDVGQNVKVEFFLPDSLQSGNWYPGDTKISLYAWDGSAWQLFMGEGASGARDWTKLYYLDGSKASDFGGNWWDWLKMYIVGERGETKTGNDGDSVTYSGSYGVKKRTAFMLRLPPDDGQDSSTGGISQCKLKLEVYYDDDGKTTYEFENSTDQYYGLQNINKKYLVLFHPTLAVASFIQLESLSKLPTSLTVTADHNEEITQLSAGLTKALMFWGRCDTDPTLDSDADGIPDVIEDVEVFIDGGGFS